MEAFGLGLPFSGALFVQLALSVAVALPQAPGFVGMFQVAASEAAAAFGQGSDGAIGAFAIVLWLINVVPVTVVGLAVLWTSGLSLGALRERSQEAEESREQDTGTEGPAGGRDG
jgi:hypothetical protein